MFPIYQSLYKHLPPFFAHQLPGGNPGKLEEHHSSPGNLADGNPLFVAAAAAVAMEQAVAASKLEESESISPSPPVVVTGPSSNSSMSDLGDLKVTSPASKPFLKFSVSAILSKAKAEINEDQDDAVKTSDPNHEGNYLIK